MSERLEGLALSWMRPLRDRPMMFMQGAVAADDPATAPLFLRHSDDGGVQIGDCRRLDATLAGLEGTWSLQDGMADPVFRLIELHGWRDLSVAVAYDPDNTERTTWEGQEILLVYRARLEEVALVPRGASAWAGLTRWHRPPTDYQVRA